MALMLPKNTFSALLLGCYLSQSQLPCVSQEPPAGRELQPPPVVDWKELTTLPIQADGAAHPGLAGQYVGGAGAHLIVAGGTLFESLRSPLEAPKTYKKEILVLHVERKEGAEDKYTWKPAGAELPAELAYGGSVNTDDGLLMIGGRTATTVVAECRQLSWDEAGQKVVITEFPKLPKPLANMGVTTLGSVIYVAGGVEQPNGRASRVFWSLDLAAKADPAAFVWKELAAWDGAGRMNALLVSGFDGDSDDIYLCGGRDPGGREGDFLSDLHRFDPKTKSWSILGNALDHKGNITTFMGSPTFYVPPHHLVMIGSTDRNLTSYIEGIGTRLAATDDPIEKADCQKLVQLTLDNFPGYSRNVMAFDMRTSEWSRLGAFPERPAVATPAVPWQGGMVMVSGEVGPGRRTNKIWEARVKKKARVIEE